MGAYHAKLKEESPGRARRFEVWAVYGKPPRKFASMVRRSLYDDIDGFISYLYDGGYTR